MDWGALPELWAEYYPIILTAISAITAVGLSVYLVYTQAMKVIKPILEWIKKDKEEQKTDVSSNIQLLALKTKRTDLKAKIENTTISDDLKQEYITQLAETEVLIAKLEAGLVDTTTNNYT
jgi:hypothetical protein